MLPLLSIVIPAYNEANRIRQGLLESLIDSLQEHINNWEMIVVDDGSTDDTPELIDRLASRTNTITLLRKPHCGKGFAVMAGVHTARGEYILFADFDQATPILEIAQLLPWFEQGHDIVVGTRGTQRKQAPLKRKCLSRGFIHLRSLILGKTSIIDTQCGFKAFKKKAFLNIVNHMHVYHPDNSCSVEGHKVTPGFDVELLLVAHRLGYLIKQVPVNWSYKQCRGMNLWPAVSEGLGDLIRLRRALNQGKYRFKK